MAITATFYTIEKTPRSTRLPTTAPIRYREVSDSGTEIEIEEAAPVPLLNCVGDIHPYQSFNGYSQPWAPGRGQNKVDYDSLSLNRLTEPTGSAPDFNVRVQATGTGAAYIATQLPSVMIGRTVYINGTLTRTGTHVNAIAVQAQITSGSTTTYETIKSFYDNVCALADEPYAVPADATLVRIRLIAAGSQDNTPGESLRVQGFSISLAPTSGSWTPYANVCPITRPTSPVDLTRTSELGATSTWHLNLPSGYWGGRWDAIEGVLETRWSEIESYAGESLPNMWYSSLDPPNLGGGSGTPTTGAQVVYQHTISSQQLQPWDVRTVSGDQTISWAGYDLRITYAQYQGGTVPTGADIQIELKTPTNVLHPEILLDLATSPVHYNYMYIAEFGRYYWLDGWTSEALGLWSVVGHVDALASWRSEILGLDLYTLRSASRSDGRIIDHLYPALAEVRRQQLYFDASPWGVESHRIGIYVVSVVGGAETSYYAFTPYNYRAFFEALLGSDYIDSVMSFMPDWETLYPQAPLEINPLQYIGGVRWFPIDISQVDGASSVSSIDVGMGSVTGFNAHQLMSFAVAVGYARTISVQNIHPQSARGVYLNLAPYSRISAFFPPFGVINIDTTTALSSSTLNIAVLVDLRSGDGALRILTPGQTVETELHAQVGIDCAVGQTLARGYGILDGISAVAGVASSVAGAIGAGVTGNVAGAASGAAGAIAGAASSIGNAITSQIPTNRTIGSPGSVGALTGPAVIYADHFLVAPEDNFHRGRPVCANCHVGSLQGYAMFADADNFEIACTPEEHDAIKSYLEGGLFIE